MEGLDVIVLLGWPLACVAAFVVYGPSTGAVVALLAGMFVLPSTSVSIRGLPEVTAQVSSGLGLMFAAAALDARRLTKLRPSLCDLWLGLLCLAPAGASLTNGLGVYDAVSATVEAVFRWAPLYVVGRAYCATEEGARKLMIGVAVTCAAVFPLLLLEVRLSPRFHYWVYGIGNSASNDTFVKGYGIWRPTLMFVHSLNLAVVLAAGALAAFWIGWREPALRVFGMPMRLVACVAVAGVVITQVLGGYLILMLGVGALVGARLTRFVWPLVLLATVPVAWTSLRATGTYDGASLISVVHDVAGDRKAWSLRVRVENENILVDKALQRPFFGWGRWGRNRVYNEQGEDISITDGLWVIQLGTTGLIGLAGLLGVGTVPALRALRRQRRAPGGAAAGLVPLLAVVAALSTTNNLFNAFASPISIACCGALAGFDVRRRAEDRRSARVLTRTVRGPGRAPSLAGEASVRAAGR